MNTYLSEVNDFIAEIKKLGAKIRVTKCAEGLTIFVTMSPKYQQKMGWKSNSTFFPRFEVDPGFYTECHKSKQPSTQGTCFDYMKRSVLYDINVYSKN